MKIFEINHTHLICHQNTVNAFAMRVGRVEINVKIVRDTTIRGQSSAKAKSWKQFVSVVILNYVSNSAYRLWRVEYKSSSSFYSACIFFGPSCW